MLCILFKILEGRHMCDDAVDTAGRTEDPQEGEGELMGRNRPGIADRREDHVHQLLQLYRGFQEL